MTSRHPEYVCKCDFQVFRIFKVRLTSRYKYKKNHFSFLTCFLRAGVSDPSKASSELIFNLSRIGVGARTPFCVRTDPGVLKDAIGVPSARCERKGVARSVFGVTTALETGTTPLKSEL